MKKIISVFSVCVNWLTNILRVSLTFGSVVTATQSTSEMASLKVSDVFLPLWAGSTFSFVVKEYDVSLF